MEQEIHTKKQAIDDTVYPTLDNLGTLAKEAKRWYKALGVSGSASFSIATRGVRTISSFVNKVARDVDPKGLAKTIPTYVPVYVTDTAAIAYTVQKDTREAIDEGFSFAINVGSWLFDKEMLSTVVPGAEKMSENERTFLALGMINGAVALDIMTKTRIDAKDATRSAVFDGMRELVSFYYDYVVSEAHEESFDSDTEEVSELVNSFTDLMMLRAMLDKDSVSSSWAIFPALLFRLVADADFCKQTKEDVLNSETFGLEQLKSVLNALKTFSPEAKEILEIDSPEINALVMLMNSSSYNKYGVDDDNWREADKFLSSVIASYADDLVVAQEEDEGKDKDDSEGEGEGEGEDEDEEPKGTPPPAPSKPKSSIEKTDGDSLETTSAPYYPQKENEKETPMEKKRKRVEGQPSSDDKNRNSLKNLISNLFKPEDKLDIRNLATKYYDSLDRCLEVERSNESYSAERFVEEIADVYDNISKKSLRNLFMSETMAAVKSEPSKSGVALIQTRIANLYTDGKIFSPLPDELTERENEVIILLDASGSMENSDFRLRKKDGKVIEPTRLAGVSGVARALLEGFTAINVRCQVFLHTTPARDKGDVPFVAKIADDRSYDKEKRFNKIGEVYNNLTPDAHSITESAKHFTNSGEVGRTLIVLSDGYPECDEYRGYPAQMITTEAIKNVRDQDIEVYSIALSESVAQNLRLLYGEEWSIFPANKHGGIVLDTLFDEIVKIVSKKTTRSATNVYTQG